MPADDLTDPAPATTFAHLDATTVLSRSIAELGIYPAVDPLDSTSRMLNARILGQEHYDCARGVQRVLQARPCLLLRKHRSVMLGSRSSHLFHVKVLLCRKSTFLCVRERFIVRSPAHYGLCVLLVLCCGLRL